MVLCVELGWLSPAGRFCFLERICFVCVYSSCFVLLSCEETWEGCAVIACIFDSRLGSCKGTRITREREVEESLSPFFLRFVRIYETVLSWRRR